MLLSELELGLPDDISFTGFVVMLAPMLFSPSMPAPSNVCLGADEADVSSGFRKRRTSFNCFFLISINCLASCVGKVRK